MRRPSRLLVLRVTLAVAWGFALLMVHAGSMPQNPLPYSMKLQQNVTLLFPQGWAFFTRDPREATERIYRRTPAGLREVSYACSSRRNLFGIRRDARAVHVELVHLLSRAPMQLWRRCEGSAARCAAEVREPPISLGNGTPLQRLCGDLIIVRRPPVPWAWSGARRRIDMPGTVLSLRVRCGRPEPMKRQAQQGARAL